ncbi:multicopper oxidase domain-containing protein [Streptomyces sp. ACA25]|uniref:multicopper oxidase domain-containing protein n=1 Tax=Streptomyces sp. ACA25 TaxID=3022596 RepID=UPI0023074FD1|nr:multicopper oxidase domain-containing protein [Streptomyces sp. ACA25]MDB1088309.1 multicopper oxidase domain-containing protein [Streptomyces sp. ACA25]
MTGHPALPSPSGPSASSPAPPGPHAGATGAEGTHPPSHFTSSGPRTRHLRAHAAVVAWLALALLAVAAHDSLPVARWLAVHLFLLGGVSTALMVWSEHFTVAMCHARLPDPRWSDARLAGLNVSVVAVLAGVWADLPAAIAVGAIGVIAAVLAHLTVLVRLGRGSLGGRLGPIARYYKAGALALVLGAALGALLATGHAGADRQAGTALAHLHVNLLGWIGLPVLGTLFMLWPTVLGVRMEDRTVLVARRVLWLAGPGLLLTAGALLLGARWPAVAGLALYAAGTAWAASLFLRTAALRAPRSGAAWMLAASTCWLLVAVAADLLLMATREPAVLLGDLDSLVPVLLIGFVGQVLLGAMSYLLPIVLAAGRPDSRTALTGILDLGWPVRLALLNAGVLLLALPLPAPAGAVGWALVLASGAAFLALTATVLARRAGTPAPGSTDAGDPPGAERPATGRLAPLVGAGLGVVLTVLAVLVANTPGGQPEAGGAQNTAAAGAAGAGTGEVRTVEVSLRGMSVIPDRLEVEPGTELRLEVTNDDAHPHDLLIEDGPATPMLGWLESHTLDLGPVTADLDGWCTVPGHKAAGMTMRIEVAGSAEPAPAEPEHAGGHGTGDSSPGGLNLAAEPSPGWEPLPAALPPAPGGRVHEVELRAVEADVEVAPGVVQQMWTFGGTAPGPTLRGTIGDTFEITLINDSELGHGIDFHAGALAPDEPMRTIEPGEELVYRFTAEHAGAWLYHCSTPPLLQHLGNGMYGAVIIDPPDLDPVDREYALVASQLYLGTPGSEEQVAKMREARPDAWVFNGGAGQYAQAPLTARAGERARFWVVAAGPSDGIAFHIVGTVFDTVYKEGAHLLRPGDPGGAQVLDLAAAQGGFVETVFPEAGNYPFVDHDMRHAENGALGIVAVEP